MWCGLLFLMDSSIPAAAAFLFSSQLEPKHQKPNQLSFLNTSKSNQTTVPSKFLWPKGDLVDAHQNFTEPHVDLEGFFKGDKNATLKASNLIRKACSKHGFFQVINHGVDHTLLTTALHKLDYLFQIPTDVKVTTCEGHDKMWGYSRAHSNRFSSQLPWKETFSFGFDHYNTTSADNLAVLRFFTSTLGKEFEEIGLLYQKYCESMRDLSLALTELLAISLGVERSHFRRFFEDGSSIMRFNNYPSCEHDEIALGTGPHCDPTGLTILHQDQVGGLEICANNKWQTVQPCHNALAINIGDIFMALSNGEYKSCVHRAVVNKYRERRSLAFFLCPRKNKVIKPPEDLTDIGARKYPDFEWSQLLEFTQKYYRADAATLPNFTKWLTSSRSYSI